MSANIKRGLIHVKSQISVLCVQLISIRRYHDIGRGIGDLVIITAPRDWTMSCTKTHLTCALLARHKCNLQKHLDECA